jgi:hypothetical protein
LRRRDALGARMVKVGQKPKSVLIRRDHEDEDIQAYLRDLVYVPVWRRMMTGESEGKRVQWWDSPLQHKTSPVQAPRVHEPMEGARTRDRSSPEGLEDNGTSSLQKTP